MSFCKIFIKPATIIYNDRRSDVGFTSGSLLQPTYFPFDIYTREMDLRFFRRSLEQPLTFFFAAPETRYTRMDNTFNTRASVLISQKDIYSPNIPTTLLGRLVDSSRSEMSAVN